MKSSPSSIAATPTVLAATATVDITPPVGIHLANWGYAANATATGVHRPLLAKLLALEVSTSRAAIVALDLGWWMSESDERLLRDQLLLDSGLSESDLILCVTHTHAGPSITRADRSGPGGDLIAPYLDGLGASLAAALSELWDRLELVELSWATGVCGLAVNRDLPHGGRYVVGQHPAGPSDDALLLAQFSRANGEILAVLCNYAVHPTSLGGGNSLLSPDLVGRARELVEAEAGGSFIFLQGAGGDLSPRVQYSSDPVDADRNGEALGHAVLSTLAARPRSGRELRFSHVIESGAPLAIFEEGETETPARLVTERVVISLPTQSNDPPVDGAVADDVLAVRTMRASRVRANVSSDMTQFPVTVWHLGRAVVLAYPGEAYSELARRLRARHPDLVIVVVNLANGAHQGYLAPRAAYDDGRYPAWQSPLGVGAFENLLAACDAILNRASQALRQ